MCDCRRNWQEALTASRFFGQPKMFTNNANTVGNSLLHCFLPRIPYRSNDSPVGSCRSCISTEGTVANRATQDDLLRVQASVGVISIFSGGFVMITNVLNSKVLESLLFSSIYWLKTRLHSLLHTILDSLQVLFIFVRNFFKISRLKMGSQMLARFIPDL